MKSAHSSATVLERYSGIELRHLRLIWTVAEERSLTRAAARLRLTPSALSHQLRSLEQIAGAAVLRRQGRSMHLTAEGDLLLETAVRVLRAVTDAEDRLTQLRSGSVGTVRLSTHCFSGYHWLPRVMRTFRVDYPKVDVRIVAEATLRPVEALKAGEIDVAITTDAPSGAGWMVRRVMRDEMLLLMAPDHPLTKRSWVEPREIAREHLLAYATRPEQSALCLEILRPAGLAPARATSVRLTEAIIEMVKSSLGVAALAEWAIRPYMATGEIAARRITRQGWMRTWNAVYRPVPGSGAHVQAFVDHLAAEFGGHRKLKGL
jgi:LysR family transcriptional regulator, regulator for metE and metH